MKVKEVNVGGGVVRLEVVPTFWGETIPTRVADRVMEDFIERKAKAAAPRVCSHVNRSISAAPVSPWVTSHTRMTDKVRQELAWRDTPNEPHGIDVHVDRPLRHNFLSHKGWADAMAKYRMLEDAARACDWECREPMKGTCHHKPLVGHTRCCESIPTWLEPDFDDEEEDNWDDMVSAFLSVLG